MQVQAERWRVEAALRQIAAEFEWEDKGNGILFYSFAGVVSDKGYLQATMIFHHYKNMLHVYGQGQDFAKMHAYIFDAMPASVCEVPVWTLREPVQRRSPRQRSRSRSACVRAGEIGRQRFEELDPKSRISILTSYAKTWLSPSINQLQVKELLDYGKIEKKKQARRRSTSPLQWASPDSGDT